MKITNQKFLAQLPYIFLIILIFANNEAICNKNLKSSSTLMSKIDDPNATPPSTATSTSTNQATAQNNGYDLRTAMYVVGEVLIKVKIPKKEKDIYEKCIEETIKVDADSALKKIWEYFSKIDYKNKEMIKKDPIATFMEEAMTETNLEIEGEINGQKSKERVNCAKSCKELSVGDINEFLQAELRDLLQPYFQPIVPNVKAKNIITAFIGTYRNTDTSRRLIPRLNLLK